MEDVFAKGIARTLIVESPGSYRQSLRDAVRDAGFHDQITARDGSEALTILAREKIDWIIMPMMIQNPINALHILQVIADHAALHKVRASVLYGNQEKDYLDSAFSLGLMSCHPRTDFKQDLQTEFKKAVETMRQCGWKSTLTAAHYLSQVLKARGAHAKILELYKSLLELLPGSPPLLIGLGEAEILCGHAKQGASTLRQAGIIDERLKNEAQDILHRTLKVRVSGSKDEALSNLLGLKRVVLIDPDSSVLGSVRNLLGSIGVPEVATFENGDEAWDYLEKGDEPCLILQEWRIPGVTGPNLLQRTRGHGFVKVPIIVLSSVIKPNELPLLRECGVDNVIAKPFGQQLFFKNLIWTVQQSLRPTEQRALERKMRKHLHRGEMRDAAALKSIYMDDLRIGAPFKKQVEAEFAYYEQRFQDARDHGIDALKHSGDSLLLVGLIGKTLLKLKDYSAALKFFEKANRLSPLNVEHLCHLALTHFEAGARDVAATVLDRTKDLDPGNQLVKVINCEQAIVLGEEERMRTLVGELRSITKLLVRLKTYATELGRNAKLSEGIALLLKTREALPADRLDMQDEVTYALSHVYATFGERRKATESLSSILARPESILHAEASALSQQIEASQISEIGLENDVAQCVVEPTMPTVATRDGRLVPLGNQCLKGLYFAEETKESRAALANPPLVDVAHLPNLTPKRGG